MIYEHHISATPVRPMIIPITHPADKAFLAMTSKCIFNHMTLPSGFTTPAINMTTNENGNLVECFVVNGRIIEPKWKFLKQKQTFISKLKSMFSHHWK